MATKSLTQVIINGIVFLVVALYLTFGGKQNSSKWSWTSKRVTDLANDILSCEEWDPNESKLPIQSMMPPLLLLPTNIKHVTARQTIVDIPPKYQGKCVVYTDNTVEMEPDLPGNRARLAATIPLAIHLLSRPITKEKYAICKPPISITNYKPKDD